MGRGGGGLEGMEGGIASGPASSRKGGLSGAYLAYFRSIRVWFKMLLFFFFSSFRDLARQQTER